MIDQLNLNKENAGSLLQSEESSGNFYRELLQERKSVELSAAPQPPIGRHEWMELRDAIYDQRFLLDKRAGKEILDIDARIESLRRI